MRSMGSGESVITSSVRLDAGRQAGVGTLLWSGETPQTHASYEQQASLEATTGKTVGAGSVTVSTETASG
jgi:hypothetical protein